MKLLDIVSAILPMIVAGAVGAVSAHAYMMRNSPSIVVLDVGAMTARMDPSDPAFSEAVKRSAQRAREVADRYADAGMIVLDGRGVMRAPSRLTVTPE
ncbi:hypothetical protein RM531_08815 [Salinisphaera sp. P385]|uniref:Uncharacterized protein n=1 Tax=Spectribacter acetivorans TaxID=3075603 RepID=A0ABU3B7Z8_9GAMM|nr:hypothetical protein [Salinisphaera sp. P385]MDT0618579.1 hypothetical protein [Salinisphaera sp. P385]